ncbi:stellacyanin-like [Phragmites australis]|uniref:stellacyanin-like n=1 Tax=Phragmites australis TaxID=29695 RepID=UPI002D780905|nr:stellacyanin-like [Phragmites australis]
MAQARVALALCVLLVHGVARRAEAVSYNVGNSAGWDLSADIPSWVDGKTFYVGDVLVFQYSKYNTLDEVDEAGFGNCSAANALLSRSDGNTTVPLTAPGDRYFICGNQLYCLGGMKLHVLVNLPPAPAGAPQANPVAAPGPSTDDAGMPGLFFGGSHQTTVGPVLVTWMFAVAAVLFV